MTYSNGRLKSRGFRALASGLTTHMPAGTVMTQSQGRIFGACNPPPCKDPDDLCVKGVCHSTKIGIPQAYPGQSTRPSRPLKATKPKRMRRRKNRTRRRAR